MKTDFDAVIVGAGVAGCTAAILLAQAGWSIAIVEKQTFPRRKVCGECVAASNLPLLDALGIGESFDRVAGPPLLRVGLFVGADRITAALPRLDHPRHGWGRALGREQLDTLLLERAAALGANVMQPWSVREIRRDGDRYLVRAQPSDAGDSLTLTGSILIDAHGSWDPDPSGESTRRRPELRRSDLFAFKGNFSGARLEPGLLPVLAYPGGYGGMVVAYDGQLTLACCIRRDTLQSIRAAMPGVKAAVAVQAYLEASCHGVRAALEPARQQGPWLTVGPIRPGLRPPTPAPNRFAIGNAAGEAHPILGEGISMAIQSAWLLCGHLIAERNELRGPGARSRVGTDYAAAWRRSFASRVRAAAMFAHLAMRPATARVLLPLLRRWPGILTAGAKLGGKVRCVVEPGASPALPRARFRAALPGDELEPR